MVMNGRLQHLVSYADTDAGGVMYHARYLELAERSRLVALHDCGWTASRLRRCHGLSLAVYRLQARFQKPVFLEQSLDVRTELVRSGSALCTFRSRIESTLGLHALLEADLVAVGASGITRVPDVLLNALGGIGCSTSQTPEEMT